MPSQRMLAGALVSALALSLCPNDAGALVVSRITRGGYIVVDEENAFNPYEGRTPVSNTEGTLSFVAELTHALEAINAPRADYIAVMQTDFEQQAFAFYLGLINDTRGIGQRSPLGGTRETYDLNSYAMTAYPLTGFVFLNSLQLYVSPVWRDYGAEVICTQEFGHRYGTFLRIPPQPAMPMPDPTDAGPSGDDAAVDEDAGTPDVTPPPPPPPPGPDLAADALLGRQRAHWSYFVNSGGSPMEGNAWEEISPGVFRTREYEPRFSPLDLYIMGLIPASQVPPVWVIAEPNVMGQRDRNNQVIFRESPPNSRYNEVPVTIRGRRVTYTIDDIIRANGMRSPSFQDPDAGTATDAGPAARPDLNVIWVLLTTQSRVNNRLIVDFDRAIEGCTQGYDNATGELSRLRPIVAPMPDVVVPQDVQPEASTRNDGGDAGAEGGFVPGVTAGGGCGCTTTPGHDAGGAPNRYGLLALGSLAAALVARRRRN